MFPCCTQMFIFNLCISVILSVAQRRSVQQSILSMAQHRSVQQSMLSVAQHRSVQQSILSVAQPRSVQQSILSVAQHRSVQQFHEYHITVHTCPANHKEEKEKVSLSYSKASQKAWLSLH